MGINLLYPRWARVLRLGVFMAAWVKVHGPGGMGCRCHKRKQA